MSQSLFPEKQECPCSRAGGEESVTVSRQSERTATSWDTWEWAKTRESAGDPGGSQIRWILPFPPEALGESF